jgi:hypothetical protein
LRTKRKDLPFLLHLFHSPIYHFLSTFRLHCLPTIYYPTLVHRQRNESRDEKLKYFMLHINHSDCSIDLMFVKLYPTSCIIQAYSSQIAVIQKLQLMCKLVSFVTQALIVGCGSGMPKSLGYMCVTVDILFRCACQACVSVRG